MALPTARVMDFVAAAGGSPQQLNSWLRSCLSTTQAYLHRLTLHTDEVTCQRGALRRQDFHPLEQAAYVWAFRVAELEEELEWRENQNQTEEVALRAGIQWCNQAAAAIEDALHTIEPRDVLDEIDVLTTELENASAELLALQDAHRKIERTATSYEGWRRLVLGVWKLDSCKARLEAKQKSVFVGEALETEIEEMKVAIQMAHEENHHQHEALKQMTTSITRRAIAKGELAHTETEASDLHMQVSAMHATCEHSLGEEDACCQDLKALHESLSEKKIQLDSLSCVINDEEGMAAQEYDHAVRLATWVFELRHHEDELAQEVQQISHKLEIKQGGADEEDEAALTTSVKLMQDTINHMACTENEEKAEISDLMKAARSWNLQHDAEMSEQCAAHTAEEQAVRARINRQRQKIDQAEAGITAAEDMEGQLLWLRSEYGEWECTIKEEAELSKHLEQQRDIHVKAEATERQNLFNLRSVLRSTHAEAAHFQKAAAEEEDLCNRESSAISVLERMPSIQTLQGEFKSEASAYARSLRKAEAMGAELNESGDITSSLTSLTSEARSGSQCHSRFYDSFGSLCGEQSVLPGVSLSTSRHLCEWRASIDRVTAVKLQTFNRHIEASHAQRLSELHEERSNLQQRFQELQRGGMLDARVPNKNWASLGRRDTLTPDTVYTVSDSASDSSMMQPTLETTPVLPDMPWPPEPRQSPRLELDAHILIREQALNTASAIHAAEERAAWRMWEVTEGIEDAKLHWATPLSVMDVADSSCESGIHPREPVGKTHGEKSATGDLNRKHSHSRSIFLTFEQLTSQLATCVH